MKRPIKLITIFLLLLIAAGLFQSCSKKKSDKDLAGRKLLNNKLFFESLNRFVNANGISANLPNLSGNELEKKQSEMITDLALGIKTATDIDDSYLKNLHPELPKYYKEKLIISQIMYLDYIQKSLEGEGIKDVETILKKIRQFQNEWNIFWDINKSSIINKMDEPPQPEIDKTYWGMFWKFSLTCLIVIFVFSFYMIISLMPSILFYFLSEKVNIKLLKYMLIAMAIGCGVLFAVAQFYFWTVWAAFCSSLVQYYLESPNVKYKWAYYITGFFMVTGPIGWFAYKASQDEEVSMNDRQSAKVLQKLLSIPAIVVYLLLCFYPTFVNYSPLSWIGDIIIFIEKYPLEWLVK